MSKSVLVIDTPNTCGDCPLCVYSAEEKKYIGYCNTSNEDYYCKVLERFMEYDKVDGGVDILGKPIDCPLKEETMRMAIKALEQTNVIDVLQELKDDLIGQMEKLYPHEVSYKSGWNDGLNRAIDLIEAKMEEAKNDE